jgi:hypothetical protein
MSEAFIVVDPVSGKMRLFTNEDNASKQAFHFMFKLTYYSNPRRMTCEDVTWPVHH